ncbi:MAG TPA: trypsin-like peptidase domain-containing protein [Lacipirellulaceae bacterium]|nr:trypsin-like peptidase domain-containing protein [Lacipirellulaceae bacterium]
MPTPVSRIWLAVAALCAACAAGLASTAAAADATTLHAPIRTAQRKVVKIYGAGGVRGLEAYQTGVLISPQGHVLTALSYVLDTDQLTVVVDDGRHFTAEVLGIDQVAELAVLSLEAGEEPLPAFDLAADAAAPAAQAGDRVLALSNLYNIAGGDEPVSVLQGVVAAVAPLEARRGGFESNYRGRVYVLDAAANNPGAAGGALVDWNGRLLGVLGKELKSRSTGAWLHYALPIGDIAATVEQLRQGQSLDDRQSAPEALEPVTLAELGLVLVPDVLPRTPPYIDAVHPDSPAARAGLRADDLVVFLAGEPTASCRAVLDLMARQERYDAVRISVLRDGELVEASLTAHADDGEGGDDAAEAEDPTPETPDEPAETEEAQTPQERETPTEPGAAPTDETERNADD